MTDGPGGWERAFLEDIGRRVDAGFNAVNTRIDRLVTTETLLRVEKTFEDKLLAQADDIAELRAEQAKHSDERDRNAAARRQMFAGLAAVGLGGVFSIIVALIALLGR